MQAVEVVDFEQVLKNILQVVEVNEASALGHPLVDLDDVVDSLDVLVTEELVDVGVGVGELVLELLMRVLQQSVHIDVLLIRVDLLAYHPANTLVHEQLLMSLQVSQIVGQVRYDSLDEGLIVTVVHLDKHLLGQLGDFQVGLAGHVLHAWMTLMHKLMQLVHNCLQEGPVVDQEAGELANDIHDVRGDERLRILSLALFAEIE